MAAFLRQLRSTTAIVSVSRQTSINRFTLARWLKATAEPRLPDFLRLIEVLIDPAQGPELRWDEDGLHEPAVVGETQMTVEASSPDALCEGRLYPDLYRQFDLPTRFVSSDGRYDLTVPLHVDAGAAGTFQAGPLPSAELHRQFGTGPWDFGAFPCATLRIEYAVQGLDEFSRLIMVSPASCASGSSVSGGTWMESLALRDD